MLPVVFLSYKEPNANDNFLHLRKLRPGALRVHGVVGLEAAHKKAQVMARGLDPECSHFITVDGDNTLSDKAWFRLQAELPKLFDSPLVDHVISWNAINSINGLCYGNGGVKIWPVGWLDSVNTHESSTSSLKVDFCWEPKYTQMKAVLSTTNINGSAAQAYVAGYREGIKMSLNNGDLQDRVSIAESTQSLNLIRFVAWASVGADVPYGTYAMLGALTGFLDVNTGNENPAVTLDYTKLYAKAESAYREYGSVVPTLVLQTLKHACQIFNLSVPTFGPLQSKVVKSLMTYPSPNNFFEVEQWI